MIGIIVIGVIIGAWLYYDPYIDITEDSILMWYNKKGAREYIVLWLRVN